MGLESNIIKDSVAYIHALELWEDVVPVPEELDDIVSSIVQLVKVAVCARIREASSRRLVN